MQVPREMNYKNYLIAVYCLWIFGSLTGLIYFGDQHLKFRSTQSWVKTSAKIIESNVTGDSVSLGPKKGNSIQYTLEVVYDYRIGTRIYRSTNVYFPIEGFKSFATTSSFEKSNQMLVKYKKGKTVNAYYNPDKHAQAVLINNPPRDSIFVPMVFFLFMLVGAFSAYKFTRTQT